ncbi:MAG: hypothetical protein AAB468_01850 [Patescibacteria group bacterium]
MNGTSGSLLDAIADKKVPKLVTDPLTKIFNQQIMRLRGVVHGHTLAKMIDLHDDIINEATRNSERCDARQAFPFLPVIPAVSLSKINIMLRLAGEVHFPGRQDASLLGIESRGVQHKIEMPQTPYYLFDVRCGLGGCDPSQPKLAPLISQPDGQYRSQLTVAEVLALAIHFPKDALASPIYATGDVCSGIPLLRFRRKKIELVSLPAPAPNDLEPPSVGKIVIC